MTRTILCLMIVGVALIGGCGQDPANKTRNDNAKIFDEANRQIEFAMTSVPEDIMVNQPEFRQKELAKAEAMLKPIAGDGSPQAQLAIRGLLAEIEKSKAMVEATDAVSLWARQGGLSTRLLVLASEIRLAGANADAHAALDLSKELEAARAVETALNTEKEKLEGEANELESKIADLNAKIADLDGKRTAQVTKSEKLSREAFTSKGEKRYQLSVEASEATRAADGYTAERETLAADLSVLQSQMKLVATQIDELTRENGRLAANKVAIASIEERDDKHKALAAAARDKAQQLYANNPVKVSDEKTEDLSFVKGFAQLTTRQSEVTGKFAASVEQLSAAINTAKAGASGARGSTADAANLDVHSREVMLGFVHQEQVMIDSGYRELLKGIGTAFEPVTLESAQSTKGAIAEAIETTDARVTATKETGKLAFETAIEGLNKVITSASGSKDAETESNAIVLKIAALRGLAAITGDDSLASEVTALKTRLAELAP